MEDDEYQDEYVDEDEDEDEEEDLSDHHYGPRRYRGKIQKPQQVYIAKNPQPKEREEAIPEETQKPQPKEKDEAKPEEEKKLPPE